MLLRREKVYSKALKAPRCTLQLRTIAAYRIVAYTLFTVRSSLGFLVLHFVLAADASDGIRESNDGLPASATVYHAEKENFTQVVWSAEE